MDNNLSKEEKEILKSYRNGELVPVDKSKDKVEEYQTRLIQFSQRW